MTAARTVRRTLTLRGEIPVPSDKSITHRAVLFSALAKGRSVVRRPLDAADCRSTLACVNALGCDVSADGDEWTISGPGLKALTPPAAALDCGNSGTTMRLLAGILAAQSFESTMMGDASLSRRPMDRIARPLEAMGAVVGLREGKYAPLVLGGGAGLRAIEWSNPISSAQVKSCVLLAGLHCDGVMRYAEPIASRDHTERMLESCGAPVERRDGEIIFRGPFEPPAREWDVPGDFSSAAFFLAAATLIRGADVRLPAVNLNPTRTGFLRLMTRIGARIDVAERRSSGEPTGDLRVRGGAPMRAFLMDGAEVPALIDEIPILAVVASQIEGVSELRGLGELRVKETDRLQAVAANLRAMGVAVEELPDGMRVHGGAPLKGAAVDAFGDHRIAMAFAVAGLIADGETTIQGADAVDISYPSFWADLARLCA